MIARLRSSDFVRQGSLVLGGVLVANLFNYLFYMLIGRVVGVEAYGVVVALVSALLVASAPANVAQIVVARIAADLGSGADRPALRRLAQSATRIAALFGAVLAVIALLARDELSAYFHIGDPLAVLITGIALAMFAVTTVQRGMLQGSLLFADFSASIAVESCTKVIFGIALALRFGADGALAGLALGIALSLAYNAWAFARAFGPPVAGAGLRRGQISRIIAGVAAGQITITILSFYDTVVIKHAFDAHAAGLYAAATLVGRAVLAAIVFVPTIIMPKATARVNAGLSPLPLLGAAFGVAAVLVLIAIGITAAVPAFVIGTLAGHAFRAAAPLAMPYALAAGLLSLANVSIAYKIGLHRYDFIVPVILAALVEIVVVCLWHPSALAVVYTLGAGHGLVFLATLWRIAAKVAPAERGAPAEIEAPITIAAEGVI